MMVSAGHTPIHREIRRVEKKVCGKRTFEEMNRDVTISTRSQYWSLPELESSNAAIIIHLKDLSRSGFATDTVLSSDAAAPAESVEDPSVGASEPAPAESVEDPSVGAAEPALPISSDVDGGSEYGHFVEVGSDLSEYFHKLEMSGCSDTGGANSSNKKRD